MKRKISILFLWALGGTLYAQPSLSLEDCEKALLKNNFQLLVKQYDIEAAKATAIQAKIWDLPTLGIVLNAYNPTEPSYFQIGAQGQKEVEIQQLFVLGGKRKKEVEWAKANVRLAEIELEELLLNLKYALRKSFFEVYYNNKKLQKINEQLLSINTLLESYKKQVKNGNIALKELVRLQSIALNLKNDKSEIVRETAEDQQNLRLLTGINEVFTVHFNESVLFQKYTDLAWQYDDLVAMAEKKNPTFLKIKQDLVSKEKNLSFQKSLAIPDVTAGLKYDQNGGPYRHQVSLTLEIPIPLWNKNKGNIKLAEAHLEQNKKENEQQSQLLRNEVLSALQVWKEQKEQNNQIDPQMILDFESVYQGVMQNFQKRNITLLEFTDFVESHVNSTLQINETKKQLILSSEKLNFITNSDLFSK